MLRNFTLTIVAATALCAVAAPKKESVPEKPLVEWAREQAETKPTIVDGVTMYRPNGTDADGAIRINGLADFRASKDCGFAASLIALMKRMDSENDELTTIDFDNKRFILTSHSQDGEGSDTKAYEFTAAFQFDDNLMTFIISDITLHYREKGIIPMKQRIEKLKPATNKRHADVVEAFSLYVSRLINDMRTGADKGNDVNITHWDEIKAGKVVKGMNSDEVMLIGGKPRSSNDTGNRTQWIFSNDFIVIFQNGEVTNVIQ